MKPPEELAVYWSTKPAKDCSLEKFRDFLSTIQTDAFNDGYQKGLAGASVPQSPCPPPPFDHKLLTDLEAWRAYLRILLGRLTPGGTSLERDALKAWSIADDALALSLNKAIGEK